MEVGLLGQHGTVAIPNVAADYCDDLEHAPTRPLVAETGDRVKDQRNKRAHALLSAHWVGDNDS